MVSDYFRGWADGPPPLSFGFALGAGDEHGVLTCHVVLSVERIARAPSRRSSPRLRRCPAPRSRRGAPSTATGPYRRTTFDAADVVLVLGSGGESLFATQLARAAGATVWATPSSPAKAKRLAELGVSEVVDYARLPWWGSEVFARTGGVALVVDSGGSRSLDQAVAAVAPGGEIARFGMVDLR